MTRRRGKSWDGHSVRCFTVDDANRALPLVRAIVADLATLARDVAERRQRLVHLMQGRELQAGDPYSDELAMVRDQLQRDVLRVEGFVAELRELGVIVKNGPAGLVEFPSELDGSSIYLSWRLGESDVRYWSPVDVDGESSDGTRRPLAPASSSSGS